MATDDGLRVLVTDAHAVSALAAVRSLGARGFRVTVAGEAGRFNLAAFSRFCHRAISCASASDSPVQYGEDLLRELASGGYALLVPANDTTVTIVARQRERFEALARVALPPAEALARALDKGLTVAAARAAGVTAPETWTFDSMDALDEAAASLPFPCVVKPRCSRYWDGHGPVRSATVRFADSAEALRRVYRAMHRVTPFPLVQSLVQGQGTGVFVLADQGEPRAVFVHRRLRESNPTGGAASLAVSAPPEDRLVRPALDLFRSLRWHGVAMAEFKDPGSPGLPVLMEVNGRLWGSLPLAIAAGVDFPALMADLFLGRPIAAVPSYRVGVRCRHLKGDLSHLAAVMKGRPAHWRGPFPSRARTLLAVTPFPGRWRSYNFRWSDPAPGARELLHLAREQVTALGRRRRPRETPSEDAG